MALGMHSTAKEVQEMLKRTKKHVRVIYNVRSIGLMGALKKVKKDLLDNVEAVVCNLRNNNCGTADV